MILYTKCSLSLSLSLHLSPDPNHCQFAGLAGEIRNPPRIIERHPIPAVAKMIIPRPASLDTFWGSGKNQASVSIIKIGGFGPDTTVAIFVIVVACCTLSRGWDVTIVVDVGILRVPAITIIANRDNFSKQMYVLSLNDDCCYDSSNYISERSEVPTWVLVALACFPKFLKYRFRPAVTILNTLIWRERESVCVYVVRKHEYWIKAPGTSLFWNHTLV